MSNESSEEKNREMAKTIANILARLIKITLVFEGSYASFETLCGFEKENHLKSMQSLQKIWSQGEDVFIKYCEEKLSYIEIAKRKKSLELNQCVLEAEVIIRFIDTIITYDVLEKPKSQKFDSEGPNHSDDSSEMSRVLDMSCLFDKSDVEYWTIGHLNTDESLKETGIWINPKFETGFMIKDETAQIEHQLEKKGSLYSLDTNDYQEDDHERNRRIENRDGLYHLNAKLSHFRFFSTKKNKVSIRNVLIWPVIEPTDNTIKIAYSPLLCEGKFPFDWDPVTIPQKGFLKRGFKINRLKYEDDLIRRFARDLVKASEEGAKIFFAPEMLGSDKMVDNQAGFAYRICELIEKMRKAGIDPPEFIFLPSIWKNRSNLVYVVQKDGKIVGKIAKTVPFVDPIKFGEEDLRQVSKPELLIIHIKGMVCISAMICAQFLAEDEKNCADVLFRSIGVDLLLVPSYTPGERDFINKIGRFREYGVNVVWGNACKAIEERECQEYKTLEGLGCLRKADCPDLSRCKSGKRRDCITGAFFSAGTGETFRFGEIAKDHCGFRCSVEDSCVFILDIPFSSSWNKLKSERLDAKQSIQHFFNRYGESLGKEDG